MADEEDQVMLGMLETIILEQVTLGLEPFTLFRLRPASDGSGDPAVFVDFGGGAEDPFQMALLVISESEPQGNPVAEMLRGLADCRDHDLGTLEAVVREFNPGWLPFVFRH